MGVGISRDIELQETELDRITPTLNVNDVDTEDTNEWLLSMKQNDPRSPSENVPRTPTNFSTRSSIGMGFDPRSPTLNVCRTPVPQTDFASYSTAFDPRSPTHNYRRSPIQRPQPQLPEMSFDPRSPTVGLARTPVPATRSMVDVDGTVNMAAQTLQNLINCNLAPENEIITESSTEHVEIDFDIEVDSLLDTGSLAEADIDEHSQLNPNDIDLDFFEIEDTSLSSSSTASSVTSNLNMSNVQALSASTVDMVKKFIDELNPDEKPDTNTAQKTFNATDSTIKTSTTPNKTNNTNNIITIGSENIDRMSPLKQFSHGGGRERRMSQDSCLSTTSIDSTSRKILGHISTNSPTKRLSLSMIGSPSKSQRNSMIGAGSPTLSSRRESRRESLSFFGSSSPSKGNSSMSLPNIPSTSVISMYLEEVTGTGTVAVNTSIC